MFGIHPIANLGVLFEVLRRWEARYIIQRVKRYEAEPCLILGDFNAIAPDDKVAINSMPPWLRLVILAQGNRVYHFSIREYLAAGFTDCFRALHPDDAGFTLPPPNPNSRLDYVFANEAMKATLTDCWVVREPVAVLKASDHYPVVAEFGL
ncbi:MAG: endonuclease/exonuclease/phosphatase family protein [Anaerolineales bacterium]|nr:endonuclease/exonuclease/phosphatase family protein [Anaerolineales bacterium]